MTHVSRDLSWQVPRSYKDVMSCVGICVSISHSFIQQIQMTQCYLPNVMQMRIKADGPTLKDGPVRYNNAVPTLLYKEYNDSAGSEEGSNFVVLRICWVSGF